MNDKPDTEIAEKPNPLNPLTIEAVNIINAKKIKLLKSKLNRFNKIIKKYTYQQGKLLTLVQYLVKHIS